MSTRITITIMRRSILFLSFAIPVFIMVIVYCERGIYPGGPNTILVMDLQAQYMPFYASLRYIGKSDNSIFFNMSGALGNNNLVSYAYYLTSPMVFLTALFPLKQLPNLIYLITLFRIGGCGFSFCCYLNEIDDEKEHSILKLVCACSYALMSYNIVYTINPMWLEGVMLLPWILIGIEQVIKGKRPKVLIISIAVSMILCYYISFFSAILVFIYMIIRLIEMGEKDRLVFFRCIGGAMIGVGISMPIVFPGIYGMKIGKLSESQIVTDEPFWRYSPIDILKQMCAGRYDTVYNDGLPFIFCGSITIVFVIIYFLKHNDKCTTKLAYGGVLLFYCICMCVTPLDNAMHGFHDTACFEVRYAYVVSSLLIMLAFRGGTWVVGFADSNHVSKKIYIVAAFFVCIEFFLNTSIIISELMAELHYRPTSEYFRELETRKYLLNSIDDDNWYRISSNNGYTHNDGAWLGYNGFSYFSSGYNYELMNYMGVLGEDQSYHDLEDRNRTKLEETLMGAKYRLNYGLIDDDYDIVLNKGIYNLSRNNDALSLGYMVLVNENCTLDDISDDAFVNQNNLAKDLSGLNKNVFKEIPILNYSEHNIPEYKKTISFEVDTVKDAPMWLYFGRENYCEGLDQSGDDKEFDQFASRLVVNGTNYDKFMDSNSCYLIYLGRYNTGEHISIQAGSTVDFGIPYVAYMDEIAYQEVVDTLKENQLQIKQHKNGRFKGVIDAGDGGNMLMTLPYIKGWHIKVDGESVDYGNYRDIFLLLNLSSGIHDIDAYYISPGIMIGGLIGVVSFVCGIIILKGRQRC